MTSPRHHIAILWLSLLLTLAGCSPIAATTPTQSPAPKSPLRIGVSIWPGYFPIIIGVEKGIFAQHGVIVKPVLSTEGDALSSQMLNGDIDGNFDTATSALLMDGRTPGSIKVVLAVDYSNGGDAIVAESSIQRVEDLRGKRVCAQLKMFSELFVREMLRKHGLNASDVTLVQCVPEQVGELLGNTVEAGHTWDPFTKQVVDHGGHVLFTSAETPGLISDVLVMRSDVVKARPDDVRAFNAGWFEALDYWQAHPEESNALIAKAVGINETEVSAAGLKLLSLADNRVAFAQGTEMTSLYVSATLNREFLISTGALTTNPDPQRVFDGSFLP